MVFVNVYLLVILSAFTPGMREKQNYVNRYDASRCSYLSELSCNVHGRINSVDSLDGDEGDTSSPGLLDDARDYSDETYDDCIDFDRLDAVSGDKLSFSRVYERLENFDVDGLFADIGDSILGTISDEILGNRAMLAELIIIIVIGGIMSVVASQNNSGVKESSFYVIYLALSGLMLGSFAVVYDLAGSVIQRINDYMMAFVPSMSVVLEMTNGSRTAVYAYEAIILTAYLCEKVLGRIVLPLIKSIALISLANKLNTEGYFSKLIALMTSVVNWIIRILLALVTGVNVVKGMLAGAADSVERTGFLKAVAMLPGGRAYSVIADIFVSSGVVVKNILGIGGCVVLISILIVPVIKVIIIMFLYRVTAAITGPVGDRRYSDGVSIMAADIALLLKSLMVALLMFLICITIILYFVKGIG